MTTTPTTCDTCGRSHTGRTYTTCLECRRSANYEPRDCHALDGGYWQTDKWGIARWVQTHPPRDPHVRPNRYTWTDQELREAHTAYTNGARDERTCEGDRVYNRERKRRMRQQREEGAA